MADRVIVTIGTKKGAFVAESAKTRRGFALRRPFGQGSPVYSTFIDDRGTPRLASGLAAVTLAIRFMHPPR